MDLRGMDLFHQTHLFRQYHPVAVCFRKFYLIEINTCRNFLSGFIRRVPLFCMYTRKLLLLQQDTNQAAQKIVANVSRTAVNDTEFIRQAGLLILSRQLDESEVRICQESLNELKRLADERGRPEQQGSKPMDSDMRARSGVVLALINSNDFVTIR